MTDTEAIEKIFAEIAPETGKLVLIRKKGRVLLALPSGRQAAMRTLCLYQPQRVAAKVFVWVLKLAVRMGIHSMVFRGMMAESSNESLDPIFPDICPGSLGVMLGSPEHRVRRAIATFETQNGLEVAKIAFGQGGYNVISGEATAIESLPPGIPGVPKVLGIHHGEKIAMMRMPYFQGSVLDAGDSIDAIALLDSWISNEPPIAMDEFPEWPVIERALSGEHRKDALESLRKFHLVPTIRHGDFARWNLLRTEDGELMVLDWEWGALRGMPGIDLVHFFAQDVRLVRNLSPTAVVASVLESLKRPECNAYLQRAGWGGDRQFLALVASLAYTFGADQQANGQILEAALLILKDFIICGNSSK